MMFVDRVIGVPKRGVKWNKDDESAVLELDVLVDIPWGRKHGFE